MMTARLTKCALYARTVSHLKPAQIAHRVRLRGQRMVVPHMPPGVFGRGAPKVAAIGWPATFTPIDMRANPPGGLPDDIAGGRFCFLGDTRELGAPPDWKQAGASQLWRFHLHYFEWAWVLAASGDRARAREAFATLWCSWQESVRIGRGDAWAPYVVSLRAWSLCGVYACLVRGSPAEPTVLEALARHAAFIRAHLELDVGGNHLIKNLKALVGLGVFLGDDRRVQVARRHLERELAVQVLADGGHFERSPSYHCQVLGDLLDIGGLLEASGRPAVRGLADATAAMRVWLGRVLMPDGDVPLFNDCTLVGSDRLEALAPISTDPRPLTVLEPSGYAIFQNNPRFHLVADVGRPCPPNLPAHAHADCLSFELAVDGQRVVVDTGTSTYEQGERRAFERSTAAHNTVAVDGADQTEVWGVFRAARLAIPHIERASASDGVAALTVSHHGYRRLPGRPIHRRSWRMTGDDLIIEDHLAGTGVHHVCLRFYVAAGLRVEGTAHGSLSVGPLRMEVTGPGLKMETTPAEVATSFGQTTQGQAIVFSTTVALPVAIRTTLQLLDAVPAPAPSTIAASTSLDGIA